MHRTLTSIGIVSLFVLMGAGCSGGTTNTNTNVDAETSASDSFTGSLAQALTLGQSMKCTWSSDIGEGISYIKGNHVRTESTVNDTTNYIVNDGDCSYIWEDGEVQGIKFCTSSLPTDSTNPSEITSPSGATADSFAADQQPDVDVNCSATTINDDLFTPPADITFSNPFEDMFQF